MRDLSIGRHTHTQKEMMKEVGRPRNFTCACVYSGICRPILLHSKNIAPVRQTIDVHTLEG